MGRYPDERDSGTAAAFAANGPVLAAIRRLQRPGCDRDTSSTMLPAPIDVSVLAARCFMRRALLLDQPLESLAQLLDHHGYIQIDPINVCGRMHDLIARNRVVGYREGDLMRYLHGHDTPLAAENKRAFEHHVPGTGILV